MEHLPSAPLKLAIAQVRFAPVFKIDEVGPVAEFQKRIPRTYVAQEPVRPAGAVGSPSGDIVWLFHEPERNWTISLTRSSLALEAVTYVDFDHFARELTEILHTVHQAFEPRTEIRLGLRYVNRIEDDRLEKRGIGFFINEKLASPVGGDLGDALLSSRCELRFRERGGQVAIRHGLIDPATYLLDFDHFAEGERDFMPKTIVERVRRFHSLIERLFVWSISERYLKELQGSKR